MNKGIAGVTGCLLDIDRGAESLALRIVTDTGDAFKSCVLLNLEDRHERTGGDFSEIVRVCQQKRAEFLPSLFGRKLREGDQLQSGLSRWCKACNCGGVHFHSSHSMQFLGLFRLFGNRVRGQGPVNRTGAAL